MNTRQCYWCRRTVDRRVYFCSEKCRYEYNTAKGTDQTMYDVDSWIRIENENDGSRVLAGLALLGFIDFWLYALSKPHLERLFNVPFLSPLSYIIPALVVVVIDLLIIGIYSIKGVRKWFR